MKVILKEDILHIGKRYDVKEVSDGYARNFLLPRKLAEIATESGLKALEARRERAEREKSEECARLQALAEKLKLMQLSFKVKMGEKGKAFGSITPAKIRDALKKQGIAVEKEWILLGEPIKTMGEHTVPIKFPQDVKGEARVIMEAE